MKKIVYTLYIVFASVFCFSQKEVCKQCGLYLDSIKVSKFDCNNFEKLHVVLPYKKVMDTIMFFNIWVTFGSINKYGDRDSCVFFLPRPVLPILKKEFIIIKVFDKQPDENDLGMSVNFYGNEERNEKCSLSLEMMNNKLEKLKKMNLGFRLEGVVIVKKGTGQFSNGSMDFNVMPLSKSYNYKCEFNPDSTCKPKNIGYKLGSL